jgi:glutathione S-transferase
MKTSAFVLVYFCRSITLILRRFKTYFPHIDNVYSHRSTQRHKRKRFVSHYWDCRLKGRPPGTKKSDDPAKKKRKRVARERDLCDVKIKITEYFDRQEYAEQVGHSPPGADEDVMAEALNRTRQFLGQTTIVPQQRDVNGWEMPSNIPQTIPQFTAGPGPPPLSAPKKYYTFQRVNGNGGNGKGDGVAGPHKHTLEESDRVKKNSVVRWLAKCEKDDRRKSQVSLHFILLTVVPCHLTSLPFLRHFFYKRLVKCSKHMHALPNDICQCGSSRHLYGATAATAGPGAAPITCITSF